MARMVSSSIALVVLLCVAVQAQQNSNKQAKKPDPPKVDSKVVQAKGQETAGAAAPPAVLIEGERVRPEEAMVFTRSVLLEEGPSFALMSEISENITTVKHNTNSYRLGYSLPADKVGERWVFTGPVKVWRALSTGDVSTWPPDTFPVSRQETMRRTKLVEPIVQAEPIDEMNNLRLYYLPSLVGHDGKQYVVEPQGIAFFINPKTGYRMTVLSRTGRSYGSINKPLAATSYIYVHQTKSYPVGPLGIGRAHVPSVFSTRRVDFDVQAFPEGEIFDKCMSAVVTARQGSPLSTDDFKTLYNEMNRYTGGSSE